MRMLKNPVKVLWDTVRNKKTEIQYNDHLNFGCSVTLAGYGYPFTQVKGPSFPVKLTEEPDCNIWWNEVKADKNGNLFTTGHRIADVVAIEATLEQALEKVYKNIRKIRCSNSYFRTDIGQSKWPPGEE